MRVVFDTNLVVSAQFWTGAPRRALVAARTERFTILVSIELIDELRDVLSRPKFKARVEATGKDVETLINEHVLLTELVQPAEVFPPLPRDPDDVAVIACAVGGNADCIVSGDDDLLEFGSYGSIPVWNVNRFLQEIE